MIGRRFLVLEDHAFQRAVAVRVLNQLRHMHVLQASEGEEALALLRAHGTVDVVLCDLRMAGMDGLVFLRKAGEEGLIRSVVIVSDVASDLRAAAEQVLNLQGLQLLGCVEKPLQPGQLNSVLKRYRECPILANEMASNRPVSLSLDEVREGLQRQEFRAYFQPKMCLKSRVGIGAEVLARWVREDGRVLSLSEFLPVLERNSLLGEIFAELLDQGLAIQRLTRSCGRSFRLEFNLNAMQIADLGLVDQIRTALEKYELSASGVMLEMTEGALIGPPAASLENLLRLRMMGCGLSIGDFGMGYLPLEQLCQVPFTEVKLDAGFIRNIAHQDRCRTVIVSALGLARDLGMEVVAKGIESREQLNCLIDMGCDIGQGYYYARPMSGSDLLAWLFDGDRVGRWRA